MCFFYLLLGHMLGDFVLQTDRIAENKVRYWQWNALHASVVTLSMLLLSFPFGFAVMGLVLADGLLHHFIDLYKPRLAKRYPLPGLVYFLADQGVHIGAIYFISMFAAANPRFLFLDIRILKVLLVLAFVSSFAAILNQYVVSLFFPATNQKFFEEDEKGIGNLSRIFTVFGLYFGYTVSPLFYTVTAAVAVILIFHYHRRWRAWMKPARFVVKFLMGAAVSVAGLAFLLFT